MKGKDTVIYALRRNLKDYVQLKENGDLILFVGGEKMIISERNSELTMKRICQMYNDYKKKVIE